MRKILIVEDNDKNLSLFKLIVESMGHEPVTASDGKEGVRMAKDNLPDLILMDIQMPIMDGISALKILKADEATKHIPVIALTSYAMKGDRERFLGLGFDGYMSKPIDTESFIITVKRLLERRSQDEPI